MNDAPNRVTRRSTLSVMGAAGAAAGLAAIGRPAAAGSPPPRTTKGALAIDDALIVDEKGNVGIGKGPSDVRLDVAGTVRAGALQAGGGTMSGPLTIAVPPTDAKPGQTKLALAISGTNYLEFGAGVKGKEVNAGKIGYAIGGDSLTLDIFGAGNDNKSRKIQLVAEGGVTANGSVNATSFVGSAANLTGSLTVPQVNVTQKIKMTDGVIQRGDGTLTTKDLGLYSFVKDNFIRFVTNNGPFKFYADGGNGTKELLTIHQAGAVMMNGFLGQADLGSRGGNNQTAKRVRLKVRDILAGAPVGTFVMFLQTEQGGGKNRDDPWIAWKNLDGSIRYNNILMGGSRDKPEND